MRRLSALIVLSIWTTKPKKGEGGYYQTVWHTTDFEYGFDFKLQKDGSYKFQGYTVGPY